MLSVSYAGKNAYSADKTIGVLRDGASGANRGHVLAHFFFGGGGWSSLVHMVVYNNKWKTLSKLNEEGAYGDFLILL